MFFKPECNIMIFPELISKMVRIGHTSIRSVANGLDRRIMRDPKGANIREITEGGRQRTPESKQPRRAGRYPVGAAYRRCLQDLPERYPSPATCHRRFQEWRKERVLEEILKMLARDLKERGNLDLSECFIDGFIVVAKKGSGQWERSSAAKVRRSWQWQTALVFRSPSTLRLLRRKVPQRGVKSSCGSNSRISNCPGSSTTVDRRQGLR